MTRSLIVSVLAGVGLLGVGCAQHTPGVVASAPSPGLTGRIPSTGHYTLYHVGSFDGTGQPQGTMEVASYDLQEGERVGFRWETDPSNVSHPNAQLQLVAFAGNNTQNLGPIKTRDEKYFWSNGTGWKSHWSLENVNGFARRVTLQD